MIIKSIKFILNDENKRSLARIKSIFMWMHYCRSYLRLRSQQLLVCLCINSVGISFYFCYTKCLERYPCLTNFILLNNNFYNSFPQLNRMYWSRDYSPQTIFREITTKILTLRTIICNDQLVFEHSIKYRRISNKTKKVLLNMPNLSSSSFESLFLMRQLCVSIRSPLSLCK